MDRASDDYYLDLNITLIRDLNFVKCLYCYIFQKHCQNMKDIL